MEITTIYQNFLVQDQRKLGLSGTTGFSNGFSKYSIIKCIVKCNEEHCLGTEVKH